MEKRKKYIIKSKQSLLHDIYTGSPLNIEPIL